MQLIDCQCIADVLQVLYKKLYLYELIKEAKILGIKGSHLFGLQKLKDEIEKAKKEQETK